MRVLFAADYLEGGGAETVFHSAIAASQSLGHDTEVFVAPKPPNPVGYIFSAGNARAMLRKCRAFRPDVVHLHNFYHALSPSVLWALGRYRREAPELRVIFTAHDFHLICPNSGMQHYVDGTPRLLPADSAKIPLVKRYDHRTVLHSWLKILQHALAYRFLRLDQQVDVVVSPSHFLSRTIRRFKPELAFEVIRNPVDFPEPQAREGAEAERSGPIKLVFIGRLSEEKGLAKFLEVLSEIVHSIDVVLHIYGDGDEQDRLQSLAEHLGLSDRVAFHGRIQYQDVPATLQRNDVAVLPSIVYENAPMLVVEAAFAGIPVMTNNIGGMPELVERTTAGLACDINDPGEVARGIETLAAGPRNTLKDPNEFSFETYAKELDGLYRRLGRGLTDND